MSGLVHIEPGQWVLSYAEHFCYAYIDGDMPRALERLTEGGSGWTCLHKPADQFEVMHVEKVMPKTYIAVGNARRQYRYLVVASAGTAGEMLALRDRLFTIGFEADQRIEEETAKRMAEFIAQTRADALAEVHASLPHIFGRSHEV